MASLLSVLASPLFAQGAGEPEPGEIDTSNYQTTPYTPGIEATTDQVVSELSAEEVARELSNPVSPLATLVFKTFYTSYKGNLPGASSQSDVSLQFQPSFPFPLDNGGLIFVRPNFTYTSGAPTLGAGGFTSGSGWRDIGLDLSYGKTYENGTFWLAGAFLTIPIGGKLSRDQWLLGPEVAFGKIGEKGMIAGLFAHQWDVGGSNKIDTSLTTMNVGAVWLPGNGWSIGTGPIISYDHNASQWLVPLNLQVAKTVIINKTPWQFALAADKFIEGPAGFSPDWRISFNFAPVVKNVFAKGLLK